MTAGWWNDKNMRITQRGALIPIEDHGKRRSETDLIGATLTPVGATLTPVGATLTPVGLELTKPELVLNQTFRFHHNSKDDGLCFFVHGFIPGAGPS